MIVPMKKLAVIVQSKDAPAAINSLRVAGVLHIEHQQPPKGKDLSLLYDDATLLDRAMEILLKAETKEQVKCPARQLPVGDYKTLARHVIDLWARHDHLQEYSKGLIQGIENWRIWGDFDPDLIKQLSAKGLSVKLFQIPEKELSKIPDQAIVEKIALKNGLVHCAVISQGKIDLPFKELELPKMSVEKMKSRLAEDRKTMEALNSDIRNNFCYCRGLREARSALGKQIEFQEALNGMGESFGLAYLVGYAPAGSEQSIFKLAEKEKWGVFITEPADEDKPPVLLRNPKWVSLIDPVYKLMEVLPGYRELDVSPVFLLFLALFFGMIIGDAGYGSVYFALTLFAQRKYSRKIKSRQVFFLFYLFSFCAIMWGLLTGTFFGQQWYLASGFKPLAPALNNAKFLMAFCFLLGAIQLSIGHGLQALKKIPSLEALADVGFICLLWVGFLLAKMFVLGDPFPHFGKWLIWAGIALIILFVCPRKNLLKTIGAGAGTLALGIMGNFGDVVSYIRLFAVGLAGVAVADSVNMLAAGSGDNIVAKLLILFAGHSINIVLGPVSVLVHGIRLNVLEFSLLHGNVTWGGLAYKPLKE